MTDRTLTGSVDSKTPRSSNDIAIVSLTALTIRIAVLVVGLFATVTIFLLGSAATFWYFGQASFGRAAAWGLFTGLVRPNGMLLALPLLAWALTDRAVNRNARWAVAASILAPVAGNAVYSWYLWSLTGDPFIWISAQEGWGRSYLGATGAVRDLLSSVRTLGIMGFLAHRPYDAINAGAGLLALSALVPVARTCGWPSALFIGVNVIPPVVVGGLPSLGRYTCVLFPLHIWLASATAPRFRWSLAATMAVGQGLLAALHYTSRSLY